MAESVSVVVATYDRAEWFPRTVRSLLSQLAVDDEVILVTRATDGASRAAAAEFKSTPHVTHIEVNPAGVIAASMAAVRIARGDVVAFIDDDAVPSSDWISVIKQHFADNSVGAVGGPVVASTESAIVAEPSFGRIAWYGRCHGGFSNVTTKATYVDHLRGASCAVRRVLFHVDPRLIGSGAQPFWDSALVYSIRCRGYRVIFDPAAFVLHRSAPRPRGDERHTWARLYEGAHNEVVGIAGPADRWRWPFCFAYWIFVGHREIPGIVRWLLLPRQERNLRTLGTALRGRMSGMWALVFHQ